MKSRKGFISLICLIIMIFLLMVILYIEYISKLEYLILNSTSNNIQSYYCAEGKIYMVLDGETEYSSQLNSSVLDCFRGTSKIIKDIIIEDKDLETGDSQNRIGIEIVERENKKELRLVSKSDYNGIKNRVTAYVKLVNGLFELGENIISPDNMTEEYEDMFKLLMDDISQKISIKNCKNNKIYGAELINFDIVNLNILNNNVYELECLRDEMTNPYMEGFINKEVFLIVKNKGSEKSCLNIWNLSENQNDIGLSGIIYVEGDLIINTDFAFSGIIIVVDGKIRIEDDKEFILEGLLICDNKTSIESDKIKYDRNYIYLYGTYLPRFIEPRLYLMKNN